MGPRGPMKERESDELSRVISGLTNVLSDTLTESRAQFQWMVSHHHFATKYDIETLRSDFSMKLSEIKQAIASASRSQKEALAEIGSQVADLKQQIDDLKNAATDPDVTDADFLQQINSLQSDAQALADIVPGSPQSGGGDTNPPVTDGSSVTDPTARRSA